MKQQSILSQVRTEAWSDGFRQGTQVAYDDAYENGREQGYHRAYIPIWRFFAVFGVGLIIGALVL